MCRPENLAMAGVSSQFETALPVVSQLDRSVHKFVEDRGGAVFNPIIGAYVPKESDRIREAWTVERDRIVQELGVLGPVYKADEGWENQADSVQMLHQRACALEQTFKDFVCDAAVPAGGRPCFGPGDSHAVKNFLDLETKVTSRMKGPDPVRYVNDALRGSIIVDDINQAKKVILNLQALAAEKGLRLAFTNKFNAEYPDGYCGVHSYLHCTDASGANKIVAELQIHFSTIQDGSKESAVGKTHAFYERSRTAQIAVSNQKDREELSGACNLASVPYFAFAMSQVV